MDISVVIVNWNVSKVLRACLESVYRFTADVSFEIFVVDNGSTDGSPAMVAREFPAVKLIANSGNRGFAAANNQALTHCAGRYTLLLNPDTELVDNALKKMVEFMDARPDADGLGCRLVYGDGRLQPSCRHFPSLFIDFMETFYLDHLFSGSRICNRYHMGKWAHDDIREVDQPYGACLAIRKTALDRVGLLDERFFMYYDEVDLCYRIKKSGGKIYFTNTITVIHHANQSSKQIVAECEHFKDRSRILFFEKHYGAWTVYLLAANCVMKIILVWLVFGLSHMIVRRPRDPEYFKIPVRIMRDELGRYFKGKK